MARALTKRRLAVVALTALLVRLLFIGWGWTQRGIEPQDFLSKTYFYQGYALCAGYGYIAPVSGDRWPKLPDLPKLAAEQVRITPETAGPVDPADIMPSMLHPPGMAILIAAIHTVTGTAADFAVEILGALLDTAAACLLYWLVAAWLNARVGFVAGLIYALYPPLAYASTVDRAPEGLMSVFIIGCLACVLQSTRSTPAKRIAWCVAAGTILGAASYLRPDYLLMPVALGVGLWLYTRRFRQSLVAALTVQAVALGLLVPWAARNHYYCGRWIFTSSSVGMTVVTGLGENANPWGLGGLDEDRVREAKAQGIPSPAAPEADSYFRNVFWNAVKSHPSGYFVAVAKRLPMVLVAPQTFGYLNPYKTRRFSEGMAQGEDRYAAMRRNPLYILRAYWEYLLMAGVSFTSLLCSLYMLVRERRRFGLVFLLLCPHLYAMGAHLLTHYEPRFVLASTFCFLIGLAYVLCRGWRDAAPEPALAG